MPAPDGMNHSGQDLLRSQQRLSRSQSGRRDVIWVAASHGGAIWITELDTGRGWICSRGPGIQPPKLDARLWVACLVQTETAMGQPSSGKKKRRILLEQLHPFILPNSCGDTVVAKAKPWLRTG